jgi:hypothetical protein
MEIKYIVRDVREPVGSGRKIIGHCCNDLGRMGAGVAKALLDKWPAVRSRYVNWNETNDHLGQPFALGKTQFVFVENDIVVANIIGQHGLRVNKKTGEAPVRYEAIREGCAYIAKACQYYDATAHFPYLMGCDLAGGEWDIVEQIIKDELVSKGVEVTAYDLFNKRGADV